MVNVYNSILSANTTNAPLNTIAVGAANLNSNPLNIDHSLVTTSASNTANNNDLTFAVVNNVGGVVNILYSFIFASMNNGLLLAGVLNNSTDGVGIVNIIG